MNEEKMTNEEKQKKIGELTDRIEELKRHRSMWGHAGGMGGSMALKALQELEELQLQRYDLENGTNKYEIYKIEMRLEQLRALSKNANILKKYLLSRKIKAKEAEIEGLNPTEEELENLNPTEEVTEGIKTR